MTDRAAARFLLLETSGKVGQVAVAQGGALLGTQRLEASRRHARDLAPTVRDLLTAQGWQPRDLDAIVVSRGPGSYTGLRVGLISAQTLAYATGCAVLALDTFAVIAQQAPAEAASVIVVADAQQERVYAQRYHRAAAGWQPSDALRIAPFTDILTARGAADWLSGPGLTAHLARLPAGTLVCADREPTLESLLTLGLARFEQGQRDDLWTLEPLYARPSSAEEQWQRR